VRLVGAYEFWLRSTSRGRLAPESPALIQGNLKAKRQSRVVPAGTTLQTCRQASVKCTECNRRRCARCGTPAGSDDARNVQHPCPIHSPLPVRELISVSPPDL